MLEKMNNVQIAIKILVAMILLFTLSNTFLTLTATSNMKSIAKESSEKSLNIVTDAIFISLRTAMNTGDTSIIQTSEEAARKIHGVEKLSVYKSQATIDLFGLNEKFTTDKIVQNVFKTKSGNLIDISTDTNHTIRNLKPMIATEECLMCHATEQLGDVIGVIDLTFSLKQEDERITEAVTELSLISLLIILVIALVIYLLVKKITTPIIVLKDGLNKFFKYINKESNDIEFIKVYSEDEIGVMVKEVNKNIEKTHNALEIDQKFLLEVKDLVNCMKNGNFKSRIQNEPTTSELKELKSLINEVVEFVETSVGQDINDILAVLDSFSNHDYTKQIDSQGKVSISINALGKIISEMLVANKRLGLVLQQNSDLLRNNVLTLTKTAASQADNLKDTEKQIEEITNSLNDTYKNTLSMNSIANEVKSSSDKGKILAQDSGTSMNEIDVSTQSIRDAIDAIDQIAFQTNILSLNAAVEAATAGEAGKGFAVVAGEVRNLANRSAEAAKEIKELVDRATEKTAEGKLASDKMINGYNVLNEKINQTIELINSVTKNSQEQVNFVNNLNTSMHALDKSAINNSKVASETEIIAEQTSEIAINIVKQTESQTFIGKDDIHIRETVFNEDYPKELNKRKY